MGGSPAKSLVSYAGVRAQRVDAGEIEHGVAVECRQQRCTVGRADVANDGQARAVQRLGGAGHH